MNDSNEFAQSRRRRILVSLASALVVLALVLVTHATLIRDFHLRGDDFPLVLNSARQFIDAPDMLLWFTEGYSKYFDNYPGWQVDTAFVRPVQNLFVWKLSWLAPLAGDRIYLIGNHVLLAVLTGLLTYLFSVRTPRSPWLAGVLAGAVALSPAFQMPLWWPSFGTNLLAAVFSVASLIVLIDRSDAPSPRRVVLAATLQCLAVSAHETAIVVPVVSVLLLAADARTPSRRTMWPLAAPLVLFAAYRLMLTGSGAVYATRGGVAPVLEQIRFFVVQCFYPWDAYRFAGERGDLDVLAAVAFGAGALANVALGVMLLRTLLSPAALPRRVVLVCACAAALAPALLNPVEPRFFGLGLIVIALLVFGHERRRAGTAVAGLVITATALSFLVVTASSIPVQRASLATATSFVRDLRERIVTNDPDTVILLNDRVGLEGASAMVSWAAHPLDPDVRVVNSLVGPEDSASNVSISVADDMVQVRVGPGPSQRAEFLPALTDFSVPTQHFTYRALDERAPHGAFVARGELPPGVTLVVGTDPASGAPLILEPIRRPEPR